MLTRPPEFTYTRLNAAVQDAADRGGRELPIEAAYAAAKITLPASQRLSLARDAGGLFTFEVEELA